MKISYPEIIGKSFGRLIPEKELSAHVCPSGQKKRTFFCVCDCGKTTEVRLCDLSSGRTRSCGCLQKEEVGERSRTHGKSGTPEYIAWCGLRTRCYNKNEVGYKDYGGRGIKVCARWMEFETFYADMGSRPGKSHSIDRIDNNGDYEPKNCRWATKKEQARNQRSNINITFEGKTQCLTDWAKELNIPTLTLWNRINTLGWTTDQALTKNKNMLN